MKNQKGINVVAIIIGVVIGLIIVGIGGFLILSRDKKPEQPPAENNEPVIENTEITAEEKQKIKDEYLGYFANVAIASDDPMVDEASIMAGVVITRMYSSMEGEYNNNNTLSPDAINNLLNNNTTNTIDNSAVGGNNQTSNQTVNNNLVNGANTNIPTTNTSPIDGNNTNTLNTTTTDDSLLPKFPDGTTVISREADIQNAIFETFGQKLDNLPQILEASWSSGSDGNYDTTVLNLSDIVKANGIYTAIYTVCTPSESDFLDGTNIYGLDSYTIEAKFQKNDNPTYSEYQLISIDLIEKTTPIAYHLTYLDGKYGVIDNNGVVILETKYSKVIIPNCYTGLFVCYTEGATAPIILNERGITQFKEYDTATLIEASAGTESTWTEQNVILVQKDGLYGLVDYYGNVIYDIEYDAIEPLGYQREKLVLTKGGTKALANTSGEIITDFSYTKIGILGIDFEPTVLVTQTRTQEEVISMMEQNDYTLGLNTSGAYTILETIDANATTTVMSTLSRQYQMQIGNWQLALLDGVIPVYTKGLQQ